MLTDLMCSLEAMSFSDKASPVSPVSGATSTNLRNVPWVDVVSFNNDDQQQQFILSPSTPNPSGFEKFFIGDSSRKSLIKSNNIIDDDDKQLNVNSNGGGTRSDPDLGWVNELLM